MAHMALETWLGRTAREVSDVKEADHTDDTLREFGKCAVGLRTILHQDRALSDGEFNFMESHFRVLEMAYLRWKRKHANIGHE